MLNVNTGELQQALKLCYQTTSQVQTLSSCFYEWRLNQKTKQLSYALEQLQHFYQDSIDAYEAIESNVMHGMQTMIQLVSKIFSYQDEEEKTPPFWTTSFKTGKTYSRFHHSFRSDKSLQDYMKNGACVGIFGSFHALEWKAEKNMKYMDMEGRIDLGNLEAGGDAKIQLFEDDAFAPSLHLEGKVIGSLGEAKATVGLGTSNLHIDAEATGRVGVAKAEGEITINKEEFTVKGEVGVAALQGDIKGSFNFFGAKVTITGEGELGSAGLGAEFSSKEGELEFGGKASFLAGIGLKVKVEY